MRFLAMTAVVALCTVGAGVIEAGPSSAAPSDPITTAEMPDQGLRSAVNDALGQASGDTFTKGQAASITDLDADGLGITQLEGIEYLTSLESLDLKSNHSLGDAAVQYLAAQAADLANLINLELYSTDVSDAGATAIANDLTTLIVLNLSYTDVGDTGATAIADNLTNLTNLNLGSTDVGDTGATAIADNLTSLTSLSLFTSNVGDTGAAAIADNLPGLTFLQLSTTDVGDTGAAAIADNLPGLTQLFLRDTDVGDAGATAIADNLTDLWRLDLRSTDVGDPGVAAIGNNLTELTVLRLDGASVSDVSPLSVLANLNTLRLDDQTITAATATVGDATPNPVVDENGDPVVVTSSDPGFSYDAGSNTWSFASSGIKTLEWSTNVTVGSAVDEEFTGTITQEVGEVPSVAPQAPDVTQTSCDADGTVVAPTVVPASTDGITYRVDGTVAAGQTVTVVAEADAGNTLDLSGAHGWVENGDGTASFQVTLDEADCLIDVVPEDPVVTQASCDADGNVVAPTVVPATTDGITYRIEGTVAPGATVEVAASPDAHHLLDLSDSPGWSATTQGVSWFEVTLDSVDCTVPSNGGPPTTQPVSGANPAASGSGQLPATGPSTPLVPLVGIGLGLIAMGAGLVFTRRRTLAGK